MLELTKIQNERLQALSAGHRNRGGTGIFPGRRRNQKITIDQLLELKRLKEKGWTNVSIQKKLDLSEHIVRMSLKGHYDHILLPDQRK